jgi:hypothetical protein
MQVKRALGIGASRAVENGASSASVDVGPVVHALNTDQPLLVLDSVDDPVATAACRVSAGQFQMKSAANAMRVRSESAVDELRHRRDDLLRQSLQVTLCCR